MLTHREILWIEALVILYALLVLSMTALVLVWSAVKLVLGFVRWIFLSGTGAENVTETRPAVRPLDDGNTRTPDRTWRARHAGRRAQGPLLAGLESV